MTHESIHEESVIRRVEVLLILAIKKRASDIHLEQMKDYLRVRFRIDGVLIDQEPYAFHLSSLIIARLKILAHMNSAERRMPQDGKFSVRDNDNHIDIRVSTFPSLYGEKLVVRILDRLLQTIELDTLGFEISMLEKFKKLLKKYSGFFLVTGPTGSGKTTTLYAALSFLNKPEKNIVTLEDPVEYSLEGITQAHIQPAAGFTFEKGIRALVRQDPDVIMIGEVRDKVTARIAIEAALTGHLVLSTLHTASAPAALMRLMDMGVELFLLNAALSGILAQRLVRKLCGNCKEKREVTLEESFLLRALGVSCESLYQAVGCIECDNLGYKGRIGIFELLEVSPGLRALLIAQASFDDIYEQALQDGMITLAQDGIQKVVRGIISFEEFISVVA